MNPIPIELVVTFLKYCAYETKVNFLNTCVEYARYRYFFMLCRDRIITFVESLPKNLNVKTLKFNNSSPIINRYPSTLTELIFDNNNDIYDLDLIDLNLIPNTVKKIYIRHANPTYIKYFLRNIRCELETLVIDNYTNTTIEWSENREYSKLKKLIIRGIFFVFTHGWPKTLKYLNVIEGNQKFSYQTFPTNLKKLSCCSFETLFPNKKIENTNLCALQISYYGKKLPRSLIKLIHSDYFGIILHNTIKILKTNTIKILKIGVCDINESSIQTFNNLKKLIIAETCCPNSSYSHHYSKKHSYNDLFNHIMEHVPIIVVENRRCHRIHPFYINIDKLIFSINAQGIYPLYAHVDKLKCSIDTKGTCVTHIKWVAKEIKVLEIIVNANYEYLVLPHSIVKLTMTITSGLQHTVVLPDSLKYLKVMNNDKLLLDNKPRKLVKLDYSFGVKVDIPSKIIII